MALLKRKPSLLSMVGSEIVFCNGSASAQATARLGGGQIPAGTALIIYISRSLLLGVSTILLACTARPL